MRGRAFLDLARENMSGADELHWRGAAGRAYYALVLECRQALLRWGFMIPRRDNVHTFVRLRFSYPLHTDLRSIGKVLDRGCQLRNKSDYDLSHLTEFTSDAVVKSLIQAVHSAIDLLDAIEADPTRKTDAIKAIRTAFP